MKWLLLAIIVIATVLSDLLQSYEMKRSGEQSVGARGLARMLRLSVRELLLVITLTGLDPFALPDPVRPGISRLIAFVGAMKGRGLEPAAALYLIWKLAGAITRAWKTFCDGVGRDAPPVGAVVLES